MAIDPIKAWVPERIRTAGAIVARAELAATLKSRRGAPQDYARALALSVSRGSLHGGHLRAVIHELSNRSFRSGCISLLLLICVAVTSSVVMAQSDSTSDRVDAGGAVPREVAEPLRSVVNADACKEQALSTPLALFDAIERALCESPKTRSAWAAIKQAAANVGMSKSGYWPTLNGDAKYAYQHEVTQPSDEPQLRSNYSKAVNEETLTLGWVLYDFGARTASLNNSKQLLLAAQANQDATLQSLFTSTAKDYFGAQGANANVSARRRIESAARENLAAATARVDKGVAPVTDQLQATTALAQAVYERAKAEGDLSGAIGALAVDMSLSPEQALSLPELDSGAMPDTHFVRAVHDLLEDAEKTHPKVLAAAAQWQAAVANVHFARARNLPVLRVVGESDRSNQPVSASLGQPELPALTEENYIGLRIEIPLFDGFNRHYQIRQAEAQADLQEQGLREVQQQVAIGVWSSVQNLQTDTENLRNTDVVLESAKEAVLATQHRNQSGVGNILELLSAQNTLATSEQQWIQARLDWRTARLQLAASLGRLGMWAIE
jgi:outer membrane protein